MSLKFKLSHQGLILVAVPLVFEVIFLSILYYTLNQAELEIQRESHAKAVVQQINLATKRLIDGTAAVVEYCMTGKKDFGARYKATIAELPEDFRTMRKLVANYPKELEAVDHLSRTIYRCAEALRKAEELQEQGHRVLAYKQLASSKELYQGLVLETNTVSTMIEQIHRADPSTQEKTRAQIKELLIVGIVLNIFIAVFLALYFNKWTTKRLAILMDNTRRLAQGQPLNPPIAGSDEIAQLDKVFTKMADELAASAAKEREITANAVAAEARVRHIIESMPVGLMIVSDSGTIELINPATERMFGHQFAQIEGKNLQVLFEDDKNDKSKSFMSELIDKSTGHISSKTALKKDGNSFPVDLSITEFNRQDNKSYLVIIIDVTERYEIERLKQEFVSMVSHELRTPLTSVQGFLELLKEGVYGSLNDRGQKTIQMADRNIGRLISLIKDLLDIERLESGMIAIQPSTIEISSIVEKAVEAVRHVAEKQNISIDYSCPETSLYADGDRLVQVIINLLGNAIKFSPAESKIIISAHKKDHEIEIRVTDQGRGIPAKYQQSIFERFQQVESADSKQKGGTGLGLAICKAIVSQHGGSIGVDSELGKGASFWFRIPLSLQAMPSEV